MAGRIYSVNMSPVLSVILFGTTESGTRFHIQAILKLYDCRFGQHLRMCDWKHVPHTPAQEADFQSYVREGKVDLFFAGKKKTATMNISTLLMIASTVSATAAAKGKKRNTLNGGMNKNKVPKKPKILPKYEPPPFLMGNVLSQTVLLSSKPKYGKNANEASSVRRKHTRDSKTSRADRYRDYWRMCASMPFPDTPQDLLDSAETARFFEVKGILLDFIPSWPLSQLPTMRQGPQNIEDWQGIGQAAVDAAHEIDKRGVLNRDCSPRNVVVDAHTWKPFIIDFAKCDFREELIRSWKQAGQMKEDDDSDVECWEEVVTINNEEAIGDVMTRN